MTFLRIFTVFLLGWYWLRIAQAVYLGVPVMALVPFVAEQVEYLSLAFWLIKGNPFTEVAQ